MLKPNRVIFFDDNLFTMIMCECVCIYNNRNYIAQEVIPLYGNTHTTTSITGKQSTSFRHESRQIIAESVNAKISGKAAVDVVLFCGNGTTAAINKIVTSFGLFNTQQPFDPSAPSPVLAMVDRPVVFISSYEHHSNIIPWRESIAEVVDLKQF